MMTKIRQWAEIIIVIAIAGLLLWHFVIKPQVPTFALPGMPSIKVDTKEFKDGIQKVLKHIETQNKQINDLESQIRQLQNKTSTETIPEALKETDVKKSVKRLREAW